MGVLCDGADAVDFSASCVREFWGLLLPAIILFVLLTAATPKPGFAPRLLPPIRTQFENDMGYEQVEALSVGVIKNTPKPVLLERSWSLSWRTPAPRAFRSPRPV